MANMEIVREIAFFVALLFLGVAGVAQGVGPCAPLGSAITHHPPPVVLPGHSITFQGTFTKVNQNAGACASGSCEFEFDIDITILVQPTSTPVQGELCLTAAQGGTKLACAPTSLVQTQPGTYVIRGDNLKLTAVCGNWTGWTYGFWYLWNNVYINQPVITADLSCNVC